MAPPPTMTIDWGRSRNSSASRLVITRSPSTGRFGSERVVAPVATMMFFACSVSPEGCTLTLFGPVTFAVPRTRVILFWPKSVSTPETNFATTSRLRSTATARSSVRLS